MSAAPAIPPEEENTCIVACEREESARAESAASWRAAPEEVLVQTLEDGRFFCRLVRAPRLIVVTTSEDRLLAYLDLLPMTEDEPRFTAGELDAALDAANIVHGRISDRVQASLLMYDRFGKLPRPVRIAQGKAAVAGTDGQLHLSMQAQLSVGEVDSTRGRVDFRQRNMLTSVAQGQRVGVYSGPEPGKSGMTVDGQELVSPGGQENAPKLGSNLILEPILRSRSAIISQIDGSLRTSDDGVMSVADVIDIDGDVDFSTGHLDANGAVNISGTVRSGFRVTARNDITITGAIEDAVVKSGGNITVGQGIIGGEKGHVSAAGTLEAKYAQNARMTVSGDMLLHESVTNCTIDCGGSMQVNTGHGRLQGGECTLKSGLRCKVLGSPSGTHTIVRLGGEQNYLAELKDVEGLIKRLKSRMNKLRRALVTCNVGEQQASDAREGTFRHRRIVKDRRQLVAMESRLKLRRRELKSQVAAEVAASIEIEAELHQGVEIRIHDRVLMPDEHKGLRSIAYDAEQKTITES